MADWPTHRSKLPARKARTRWEARKRKRDRAGIVPQKAKTRDKDTAPIADWRWAEVHRSTHR